MSEALYRLKDWRIWLGSTLVLLIQALISVNLMLHTGTSELGSTESSLSGISSIIIWYLPLIVAAPFCVAYAPMTSLGECGWFKFTVFNIVIVLGVTLAMQLMAISLLFFVVGESWGHASFLSMVNFFYSSTPWHADLLLVIGLFALGYSLDYASRLRQAEIQSERLRAELIGAELAALKSQLNPHFLFNVLNGVSGLIRSNRNEEATDALSDLSSMLRTILENRNEDMVSIKNEVAFIECYLALQGMRFRDKLTIQIHVEEAAKNLQVPFMVLQPLVENAIQHGSQMEKEGNLVTINIKKNMDSICFELTNRVPQETQQAGFGVGIGNNRERLQKIYGTDYSLELQPQPERYFKTTLTIPAGA